MLLVKQSEKIGVQEYQSQYTTEYLSENLTNPTQQFNVPHFNQIVTEAVTSTLEKVLPAILEKQVKKGRIDSFVTNEWEQEIANNVKRFKSTETRLQAIQKDYTEQYNYIVSQLHATNRELNYFKGKLTEIIDLLKHYVADSLMNKNKQKNSFPPHRGLRNMV